MAQAHKNSALRRERSKWKNSGVGVALAKRVRTRKVRHRCRDAIRDYVYGDEDSDVLFFRPIDTWAIW